MSSPSFVPYCGRPPVPGGEIWNTDPILASALLGIGLLYALGCHGRNDADAVAACYVRCRAPRCIGRPDFAAVQSERRLVLRPGDAAHVVDAGCRATGCARPA